MTENSAPSGMEARVPSPALLLGIGLVAAAGLVVLWVGLTALTGKTYHLAPLLAALAPGLSVRLLDAARRSYPLAAAAALLGASVSALAWGFIVAWQIEPTATIVSNQPGGVTGEVLVGILIGSAAGAATLRPVHGRA
jgi:hypothetical protein